MKLEELRCISNNIDLNEYFTFKKLVKDNMIHPDWLREYTKEDIENQLNNGAKIWIYYDGKIPVCSMMMSPSTKEDMLEVGIKMNHKKTAFYRSMFVNPKYVGNKLQYQMLLKLDEYCKEKGYENCIGTVHPDNIYSINNITKDDFKIVNIKKIKSGIRNIYLKKI